jgi:hypothetical protein
MAEKAAEGESPRTNGSGGGITILRLVLSEEYRVP